MTIISRATNLVPFNLRSGTTPNKVKSSHYKDQAIKCKTLSTLQGSQISSTAYRPAQFRGSKSIQKEWL